MFSENIVFSDAKLWFRAIDRPKLIKMYVVSQILGYVWTWPKGAQNLNGIKLSHLWASTLAQGQTLGTSPSHYPWLYIVS